MDPDQLARIEAKLDKLIAIWEHWEPLIKSIMDSPAMRFAQWRKGK